MGKDLKHEHPGVEYEEYQPGCLGGIVHILDYHHRNNDRKIIQRKKHHGRRRAIGCLNSETISMNRDTTGEVQSLLVAEADDFLVEQQSTRENHNHWLLGIPAQPQLQRLDSIHHLEPSDRCLAKMEWTNPIIVLRKSADTSDSRLQVSSQKTRTRKIEICDTMSTEDSLGQNQVSGKHKVPESSKYQKQMGAKNLSRETLHHQVKENVDVLEILKVNKELFLDILQDPEVHISKQVFGQQTANRKAKFTKAETFPVADLSHVRYLMPTTLEHKQNEPWTFRKGEKLVSGIQAPKLDEARSQKGYNENKMPPLGGDNAGITKKHRLITSSWGSFQGSHHQWWKHSVIGRLRDMKQRIKHAIKECKKENNSTSTDGPNDKCTGSTNADEIPKSLENISLSQGGVENSKSFYETDGYDKDLSNSTQRRIRRTSSLNESLDRYALLFGSNFNGEAKMPHSMSLKLRNKDRISSKEIAPKFFRRVYSLSDVESFYSLLNEPLEAVVETEFHENMAQGSDSNVGTEYSGTLTVARIDEEMDGAGELGADMVEPARVTSIPQQDQEIDSRTNLNLGLAQPSLVSDPETCFLDNTVDHVECPISEVSVEFNQAASSFDIQNTSSTDSLRGCLEKVNHEKEHDSFLHFEMDIDDASFNYVREVLELSGFIGNESLGAWYSLDQPLNPSLFKQLEGYLHHEPQSSTEEEVFCNCDHQLLFDLICETLLEINERSSFTYFPRAMPEGQHVLEEVWARIRSYIIFRSELNHSLDDIVAPDLAKRHGWMTRQFETECVALELEDLIFDELFDEVI